MTLQKFILVKFNRKYVIIDSTIIDEYIACNRNMRASYIVKNLRVYKKIDAICADRTVSYFYYYGKFIDTADDKKILEQSILLFTNKASLNMSLMIDKDVKEHLKNLSFIKYYDYDRQKIEEIANKSTDSLHYKDIATLVQVLFPRHIIYRDMTHDFVLKEITQCRSEDRAHYYFSSLNSYLNDIKTKTAKTLLEYIQEIFETNNIRYSTSWSFLFDNFNRKKVNIDKNCESKSEFITIERE